MDILLILPSTLTSSAIPIRTVEMHTTDEPTRIVCSGFPSLCGRTLLEKRLDAKAHHDDLRKRLMYEPRGHSEMYGALLVLETEFTASGEADRGVLFMHNEGWSSMCGHATIALGRFVVDAQVEGLEPLKKRLEERLDRKEMTTRFGLHCPCGVIDVTVPIKLGIDRQLQSDSSRSAAFLSVESFASGTSVKIVMPEAYRWPELRDTEVVIVDFCYGGAFYCVIDVNELGFHKGLKHADLATLSLATKALKAAIVDDPQYAKYYHHETQKELGYLYGMIISDERTDHAVEGTAGGEMGLCFFADQQVDRSPTGSGVVGRRALAHAKRAMSPETKWAYHSILSDRSVGQGAFVARMDGDPPSDVGGRVLVEGQAFYTSLATYLAEEEDAIGRAGFVL